ncbi:RNA exonuclease 3 [Phlyctochytrium bullatum]|nr:RNA exonuclease 3 [Phlyctochytrium bullatum]
MNEASTAAAQGKKADDAEMNTLDDNLVRQLREMCHSKDQLIKAGYCFKPESAEGYQSYNPNAPIICERCMQPFSPKIIMFESDKTIPFSALPSKVANEVPVVACDCEMSYTSGGVELVRVTVIDWRGEYLLEELVKTTFPVVDFNTEWSGISSLDEAKYNLAELKEQMSKFMSSSTIIIGHGLENDLNALRLLHSNVIDTALLFPNNTYIFKISRETNSHDSKVQDSDLSHSFTVSGGEDYDIIIERSRGKVVAIS